MDDVPEVMMRIGQVLSPHGVRGEMRVEPLTDDPGRFRSLRRVVIAGVTYTVTSYRTQSHRVLLKLSGLDTPDAVLSVRGKYLEIPSAEAAALPEHAYYHYQLLGLRVETTAGKEIGELAEVLPREANDVYVVRGAHGEVLVPALKDVIKEVHLAEGRMVIEPVPGLLPWDATETGEGAKE